MFVVFGNCAYSVLYVHNLTDVRFASGLHQSSCSFYDFDIVASFQSVIGDWCGGLGSGVLVCRHYKRVSGQLTNVLLVYEL